MEPQGKAQLRRTEGYKPVVVDDRQVIVVAMVIQFQVAPTVPKLY